MLVETMPKNGLYHVRTEDEEVGRLRNLPCDMAFDHDSV
jgi:hypothetical protein